MAIENTSPQAIYPQMFRRMIAHHTRICLEQVQTSGEELSQEEHAQIFRILKFALREIDAWPYARELLLTITPQMERRGHRQDWIVYLNDGVKQSRVHKDLVTEGQLSRYIGVLYRLASNFEQAEMWLTRSLTLFEDLQNRVNQAKACNQLATVAYRQHKNKDAKTLAKKALDLLEEHPERAASYTVLGELALEAQNLPEATHYYQLALSIWEQYGDISRHAWGLTELGRVQEKEGKFDAAIASYKKAITLLDTTDAPVQRSLVEMNLGVVHLVQGNAQDALELFNGITAKLQDADDQYHLAMLYHNRGVAYAKLEKWLIAIEAYEQSISVYQDLEDDANIANVYESLGMVYLNQRNYERAIQIFHHALGLLRDTTKSPSQEDLYQQIESGLDKAQTKLQESSSIFQVAKV